MDDAATKTPPLQGFLVKQDETAVEVRAGGGLWRFKPGDVVTLGDWDRPRNDEPAASALPTGRPVLVELRLGAVAEFCQSFKIELANRPMTLPESVRALAPTREFDAMVNAWSATLMLDLEHLPDGGFTLSNSFTRCGGESGAMSVAISDDVIATDSLD